MLKKKKKENNYSISLIENYLIMFNKLVLKYFSLAWQTTE